MFYLYLYVQCMPYVHEKYQKILMKPSLLVLHVIQHALSGLLSFSFVKRKYKSIYILYYRLAFLPIYFTAYETGRHQVMKFSKNNNFINFIFLEGTYNNSMCNNIVMFYSSIGLSIFS